MISSKVSPVEVEVKVVELLAKSELPWLVVKVEVALRAPVVAADSYLPCYPQKVRM